MNDRITPHVAIEDDEVRAERVRDAAACYAIATAQRKAGKWIVTGDQLEKQLRKIPQRSLQAITLNADSAEKLREVILNAMGEGDLLEHPDYLPEELEL